MALKRIPLITSALLTSAGCSIYHPEPLTRAAIEGSLKPPPVEELRIEAARIHHPILRPVALNLRNGIGPDEAAILAVLLNPALRADRDRRGLAAAQLIQAGILPNPQLTGNIDYVIGGNTLGTQTGFGYGLTWDLRELLTHAPNVTAAREADRSVQLDIAWKEWQTALAAVTALYDVAALRAQVARAEEITGRLDKNAGLMKRAAATHEKTVVDAAAAEASANDARAILLGLRQELDQRCIALNKAIGYAPGTNLRLQSDVMLPSSVSPPSEAALLTNLENRRLDLLALKRGYESQDAKLRSAIIAQFPSINIGFSRSNNESNVHFAGPTATIALPIFDRNQGNIAIERATRQQLLDEYTDRVFEAHSDIAAALSNIRWLNAQIVQAERALPTLDRLVKVSEEAVAQGNADVLGYYAAQNNLTQKSIDILKLKQQLAQNRVALEIAAAWHLSP